MIMSRTCFTIATELQGNLYQRLLDYAVQECAVALLVVHPSLRLSAEGEKVLHQLAEYLKEKAGSSVWPGTELLTEVAHVYYYHLSPECVGILKDAAAGLYSWQQPHLPEDLCLLKADGEPWLVSIVHERDSYFCLSEAERTRLLATLPELVSLLKNEDT